MLNSVLLSSKAIGEAAKLENEMFTFVFGGRDFVCTRFQASFISGRVRRLLWSDAAIDHLHVEVDGDASLFDDIVSLMNGECVSVNGANVKFMKDVSICLDNDELLDMIMNVTRIEEELSVQNVIDRLRMKSVTGLKTEDEIVFIASRFYEFDEEEVNRLSNDELDSVLECASLQVKDEDSVLDVVLRVADSMIDGYCLLRHVRPEYLSQCRLSDYFESIVSAGLEDGLLSMCNCVRRFSDYVQKNESLGRLPRFGCSNSDGSVVDSTPSFVSFEFEEGAPFNGIVCDLNRRCGGNVHEKGVVNITASSSSSNQHHKVTNYGWSSWWQSDDAPNSWIMFEFKTVAVSLTSYSLKSDSTGMGHLVRWEIECSDDGSSWTRLDERDTHDLDRSNITKTFTCSSMRDEFFRFVRLRQSGRNSWGNNHMRLSNVEFFGRVKDVQ